MAALDMLVNKLPTAFANNFPADNTDAVVTLPAPGANRRHYITGLTVSCDGTPSQAITVTVVSGARTVEKFFIPPAAFAPIVITYRKPLEGLSNTSVVVTATAPGASVAVGVAVRSFDAS